MKLCFHCREYWIVWTNAMCHACASTFSFRQHALKYYGDHKYRTVEEVN